MVYSNLEHDYLILADRAEVLNDKLYLMGGGWTAIRSSEFPLAHPMAVALGVLVPWEDTNVKHQFKLTVRDEDSQKDIMAMEGQFEQGRPPGIPPGTTQVLKLAANFALPLERPCALVAELQLNGRVVKTVSFHAVKPGD